MKMEQIECSETSAYINQMPGNHPKENTQRIYTFLYTFFNFKLEITEHRKFKIIAVNLFHPRVRETE